MSAPLASMIAPLAAATVVICYPTLSSISTSAEGETLELGAEVLERSFEVEACVTGAELDSLTLDLDLDANTAIPGELMLRADGRNYDLTTNSELTIEVDDNCEPELLIFEVLDPELPGTRSISWTVEATATGFGRELEKDGELSLEITPL